MTPSAKPVKMDEGAIARAVPFVRALGASERKRLLSRSKLRRGPRGVVFWSEGGPPRSYVFVVRGRVKLTKSCLAGHSTTIDIGTSGDLLCATAVYSARLHCCGAVAIDDDTEVLVSPWSVVLGVVSHNPKAAMAFLANVTCCGMRLCHRIETLAAGQAERRIASFIVRLGDRHGVVQNDGSTWIHFMLTRDEIADFCGVSVETVIRVMSQLERERVVATKKDGFLILRRAVLEEIIASEGRR